MNSVLVLTHYPNIYKIIRSALHPEYSVERATSEHGAFSLLENGRRDLLFVDIGFLAGGPKRHWKDRIREFRQMHHPLEIVVMAPPEMIREVVNMVKAGVTDYLTYPIVSAEVRLVTENLKQSIQVASELEYLRRKQWKKDDFETVQTRNPEMRKVFQKIRSVAPTKSTVLLMGETGVGKGVLARLIHRQSSRDKAQFISLHCGAIPETLVESELFGHEKGAFTGAVRKKQGKFEIAHEGTLFLDEIGTITPAVQIRLLQVLQDGTFSRVGGDDTIEADTRVIAATNENLKKMSDEGTFRKDLFYRLNVFPIDIPPLRDRIEDIPFFVELFLKKMNLLNLKEILDVHPLVYEALKNYSWPGNIRELENIIERACILEPTSMLTPESFPAEMFDTCVQAALPIDAFLPLAEARRQVVEDFERRYIQELLKRNQGKINRSSEEAGIGSRQLHKLMIKYGIHKEEFKQNPANGQAAKI